MASEQTWNTIVALAGDGNRPRRIFELLNKTVSIGVIYKTLKEAKRRGILVPDFRLGAQGAEEVLTHQIVRGLAAAARERRCSIAELARRLLLRIAEDHLVEAVLDDRKVPKRAPIRQR